MEYRVIEPPDDLSDIVQSFWSVRTQEGSDLIRTDTFVDLYGGIIIQHKNHSSAIVSKDKLLPEAMIHGLMRAPTTGYCKAGFSASGVRLLPHAIQYLFGTDAHYLTDHILPIDQFVSVGSLKNAVLQSTDVTDQAQLMFGFLRSFKKEKRKSNSLVRECIGFIHATRGSCSVLQIREYFNVSERKLQRDFLTVTGVSPRHYIQVTRFMEIIGRLKSEPDSQLFELAFELNFTDQPHFNNAIRKFSNLSPRKLGDYLQQGVLNLIMDE
jgi:AraC-like DNA-binding protein